MLAFHFMFVARAEDLSVDTTDGLVRGAIVLSHRFGSPVIYEGAPISGEVAAAVLVNDRATLETMFALRFTYPRDATIHEAVARMVTAWNDQHDGVDYVVATDVGRAIHVRPAGGSPLDRVITLPQATGTATEIYRLVLVELAATGLEVSDPLVGFGLDDGSVPMTLSTRTATAAALLDEVLFATENKGTWYFHQPAVDRGRWQLAFVTNLPQNEWTLNRTPMVPPPPPAPIYQPWDDPVPPDRLPDDYCDGW